MTDPIGPFRMEFTDGRTTTAELIDDFLTVTAWRTRAGTKVPQRIWPVAERSWNGDVLHWRLGRSVAVPGSETVR
ncbi:hypothetical protein [Actinoplanes couchii]|uniref:Uncharacterized protein n=1 Tax=Actinoplanes couchii TaxID=403638 RepID=A0ABQ3XMN2_9ACTN|nr:hypothetical protein [Actinoplanes couchii]MDR6321638.1 hypothetical protein [Actinoplanes couchii]GID59733.1 hypothetical protein Aco03nite_081370 [Actinoplanes couchii]